MKIRYPIPPCPVCKIERTYSDKSNAKKAFSNVKPCHSCANSIKAGGQGNLKQRGCMECGEKELYSNSASLCKSCHNKRSRKYHREIYRWSKYGLDGPVDMTHCEICSSKDDLVIDHCHDSNEFRGILCRTCNVALGLLKENLEVLKNSVRYAERTFKSVTRK